MENSKSYSSMTQFFNEVLRVQNNATEILSKLSSIVAGSNENVIITQTNTDGTETIYELPSVGYMMNEISRIDQNFEKLSGMQGDAYVRMADGSFKKLIEKQIFSEPRNIESLSVPTKFYQKPNWFFESFLNPLLYVNFDITKYADFELQKVFVKRIIFDSEEVFNRNFFDNNYKNKNDISYDVLIKDLIANNIGYFVDDNILDLPSTIIRYTGNFTVRNIVFESDQTLDDSGKVIVTRTRKYIIDTLNYTDNLSSNSNTMTLKVGDKIMYNESEFFITFIDNSSNKVTLKKLSGTDNISIGSILYVSPQAFSVKNVQVNVGFDEREVIFIKPVDKDNVTTTSFSPGVGIYTNELKIQTPQGEYPFEEFYNSQVTDFGNAILSLAKEKPVPSIYGLIPDAPLLEENNFKVTLINTQKLQTSEIDTLKKKASEKNSIASELAQLDVIISKKKLELNSGTFNTDIERNAVKNQLTSLIEEKTAKSNLYASIVQDLSTVAQNPPGTLDSPKYRVRGFWPIPAPKKYSKSSTQNVIQFIVSYRYLRLDGTAPGSEQYDFISSSGTSVRAYFSSWNEYKTDIRKKVFDEASGVFIWADENVQDSDIVNINQLDIPISKGEKVEIRIKSISEAGWPVNPAVSDWSSSVTISFPSELEQEAEVSSLLKKADAEAVQVQFQRELSAKGIDVHLESSYAQKEKYFAHTADFIASGFYNSDGSSIDLFTKLKEVENRLNALTSLIEQAKGTLSVSIVDIADTSYSVSNNSTVSLFSGYYLDRIGTLVAAERKGAIFTDIYKIVIENSAASPLQLASMFPGGFDINLPDSGINSTNQDYIISRKYDKVPITISSITAENTYNTQKYHTAPFQSSQVPSQFIFQRFTDIGLSTPLVKEVEGEPLSFYTIEPPASPSGATASFVWNEAVGTAGDGYLTDFCVHVNHPDIGSATRTQLNRPTVLPQGPAVYPKFRHSYGFNLDITQAEYLLQTRYFNPSLGSGTADNYPLKLGFYSNDRYLIGAKTCGSYLYLAPYSYTDILVNGTDYRSVKSVNFGSDNKIEIPVIFQFRMTDFYGEGDLGSGKIGGTDGIVNLTYTKKIGIDITPLNESTFSFDLQISAKYKADTPSQITKNPTSSSVSFTPSQTKKII